MSTTVTGDREIAVHLNIASVAATPIDARTWWILSPVGQGTPFDRTIFESRVYRRIYAPQANVAVNWKTLVDVPSGLYNLVLTIHSVNSDGSEVYVDSSTVGPIRLDEPRAEPWLIRRDEASGPTVVVSATGPGVLANHPTNPFSRFVTIANQGMTRVDLSIQLEARTSLTGWEDKWWLSTVLFTTAPIDQSVPAGQSSTISIDTIAPAALAASFPMAATWIVVTADGQQSDHVLLGDGATFQTAPSQLLARRDFPSGPAELTNVAGTGPWTHKAVPTVTLVIANMSGAAHLVQGGWFLSFANDQQPWTDAVVSGTLGATLGPWETRTIAVKASHTPPVGRWQLTGRINYQDNSGAMVPDDTLVLIPTISVT